jgi:membrane protein DedA with SNARE-associated domain
MGRTMEGFVRSVIAFMQTHEGWGAPIAFLLAFCESFAFVSLAVPATAILFGVGGLIAAADIAFWPIWCAAALGAVAGDWLAYELAFRFKDRILTIWPFSRHPDLISRGVASFKRWGIIAVFVGRFFGPLRAIVPIMAGAYGMPRLSFQIANVASAALWAAGVLSPGFLSVRWLTG